MEVLVIITAVIVFGGILYVAYDASTHKSSKA